MNSLLNTTAAARTNRSPITARLAFALGVLAAIFAAGPAALASNGTSQYFDVNSSTAGFGTPSSTTLYDQIGATNDNTTLTTGFGNGATVTSVVVASATGIAVNQTLTGTGVPLGVLVTSVSGTNIGVSSFTSSAASSGSYNFGFPLTWTTNSAGTSAATAFTSGDAATFGAAAGDTTLQGTFSVNIDSGGTMNGVVVNSTGLNVTLTGSANTHATSSSTWTVNSGSTLTLNDTRQGFDAGGTSSLKSFNFNGQTISLTGGGTINFASPMGCNDTNLFTENMPGGTINFKMGSATPSGAGTFTGGFTLTAGTLNFATAGSANQFYGFTSGKLFTISAGTTIDNTSGSAMTLNWAGGGGMSFGGDFTFTGSANLDLGTAAAALTATRQITVSANTLSIGGVISGSGFGLTKAGSGTLNLYGANSYTGTTAINAGTLALGSTGSISTSPTITLAGGTTFDVSAVSSYSLGGSQTLSGTGSVNGAFATASGANIYPATDGTAGTLAFNNNVNLSAGGTLHYDVSTSHSSGNDQITVAGTLNVSGNTIHLKAPSTSSSLDTTADYVLMTVTGGITGSFNVTPVWDVTPVNSSSFSIVTSASQVTLHYTASAGPSITAASATPSNPARRQNTLLSVSASGGTAPLTAVVDASSIGGSSTLSLVSDGAGNFTNTIAVAGATTLGSKTLPVTVTDNASLTANASIMLTVTGAPLVWNGTLSGPWDTSTTDWQGGVSYGQGDFVTFDDTLTGTTNVNLTTALSPGSVTVNNTASNYVFSGTGKITGTNGLTKQGTGTLILDNSGSNDFTGTVTLTAGTLQVGNGDANGNLPAGNLTDNGVLVFNRTDNVTNSSVLSSSGALVMNGSGTNTLAGANNSFTGNITISNGMLRAFNTNSLGSTNTGVVIVTNGGSLDLGFTTAITQGNPDFGTKQFVISGTGVGGLGALVNNSGNQQLGAYENVKLGANATIGGTTRFDWRNGSAGYPLLDLNGFTLTKSGTNQVSLVSPTVTGGSFIINQGTLSFETTCSFSGSGTITVNAAGSLGHFRTSLGTFTRPVTLNGGAITNLTTSGGSVANDAPITLTASSTLGGSTSATNWVHLLGTISESGGSFGLTKVGSGPFILAGTETYSGATVINSGSLMLTNTGTIANSSPITLASTAVTLDTTFRTDGTLTLGAAQTLQGIGTVKGSLVVNGTISPGLTSFGTLTNTGTTTLNPGGAYNWNVTNAPGSGSLLSATGGINVQSTSGNPFVIKPVPFSGGLPGGALPGFNSNTVYSWTIASTAGTVANFAANDFAVNTTSVINDLAGGVFSVSATSSTLALNFTPNHAPVAATMTVSRQPGMSVKILLSDLATNWSDPDSDTVSLVGVAASSTNGMSNVTTNATYLFYQPGTNGDVTDAITYTIDDHTRSAYRMGDTIRSATGMIMVNVVANTNQTQNIVSLTTLGDGNKEIAFAGIPGRQYRVQATDSLTPPITWTDISTNTASGNGLWTVDDLDATNHVSRFYRSAYP